jgi:hypothetical protein
MVLGPIATNDLIGHHYVGIAAQVVRPFCNRRLRNPESIGRGVGSDCWLDVLAAVPHAAERRMQVAGYTPAKTSACFARNSASV